MSSVAVEILIKEALALIEKEPEVAKSWNALNEDITKLIGALDILEANHGIVYNPSISVSLPSKTVKTEKSPRKSYERSGKESFRSAVLRVMKEANRYIHIKEIKSILDEEGKHGIVDHNNVSKALTNLRFYKGNTYKLDTKRDGHVKNTFWGFESYLDENEKIKPEHMYRTDNIDNTLPRHKESPDNEASNKEFGLFPNGLNQDVRLPLEGSAAPENKD